MSSKKHNANLKSGGKRPVSPNRTRQTWDDVHKKWMRIPETFMPEDAA